MSGEKAGTLAGLENLSNTEFMESALIEQNTATITNSTKNEESEEEKAAKITQEAKENKIIDTNVSKTDPKNTGIVDEAAKKAKEVADNKTKWTAIEAKKYEGKSADEVKKLQEADKKADLEKYKGKSEDEIIALKLQEHEDNEVPVIEFQLPEEQKQAAKEGKFTAIAKEIGFDITEDKIETFKEELEKHYAKKYEINFGKYSPESQRFIQFLENGGNIESFVKPFTVIDSFISLSDVDLVTKDLEARKWDEDKIAKEITRLTENDLLDVSALRIRESLNAEKSKMTNNILLEQEKASKLNADYKTKSVADQVEAVSKALNTVSEYMETPLTEKHREYVAKRFADGKYADILKDPKAMADFLLYQEFGKHGIANIKTKATQEAKLKYKQDRHNIPPLGGTGVGSKTSQNSTGQKAEGNWAALPVLND